MTPKELSTSQRAKEFQEIVKISNHEGPLPSPVTLSQYADLIPDGANRIMVLAESHLQHSIDQEKEGLRLFAKDRIVSLWCSVLVAGMAFSTSAYLAFLGFPVPASIVSGSTLAVIIVAILKR